MWSGGVGGLLKGGGDGSGRVAACKTNRQQQMGRCKYLAGRRAGGMAWRASERSSQCVQSCMTLAVLVQGADQTALMTKTAEATTASAHPEGPRLPIAALHA